MHARKQEEEEKSSNLTWLQRHLLSFTHAAVEEVVVVGYVVEWVREITATQSGNVRRGEGRGRGCLRGAARVSVAGNRREQSAPKYARTYCVSFVRTKRKKREKDELRERERQRQCRKVSVGSPLKRAEGPWVGPVCCVVPYITRVLSVFFVVARIVCHLDLVSSSKPFEKCSLPIGYNGRLVLFFILSS